MVLACDIGDIKIKIAPQLANSPDCNVLDLGFFRALQTRQVMLHAVDIEDVVSNTLAAWKAIDYETL